MRVDPRELHDGAVEVNDFGRIELRGEGMVRVGGEWQRQGRRHETDGEHCVFQHGLDLRWSATTAQGFFAGNSRSLYRSSSTKGTHLNSRISAFSSTCL